MERIKVFLPDVRISYPSLVEPRAGLQGGDPKYDATFLMAPDSGAAHNLTTVVQDIAPRLWQCRRQDPAVKQPGQEG